MSDPLIAEGGVYPSVDEPVTDGVSASLDSETPDAETVAAADGDEALAVPTKDDGAVPDAGHTSEIDGLRQQLDDVRSAIGADLADLARSLGERLSSAAQRETIIDKLHVELQEHRRGSHLLMFKPFFNDLIMFYDHLQQAAADHSDDAVRAEFASYADELADILERNDLEMIASNDETSQLDRKTQRVMKVETTHDPDLDGTIARRLRNGFRYRDEFVVRPEQVVTWNYEPAPAS